MRIKKYFRVIVLFPCLFGCFALGGCTTATSILSTPVNNEIILKDLCQQLGIQWKQDLRSGKVELKHNGRTAELVIGSEFVNIGSKRVVLSAPVRAVRNIVLVPEDFSLKAIRVLRGEDEFVLPRVREIMLDPGHGGKDPGAVGPTGTKEKEIVLDVSKRLKKYLQQYGFKVKMTRSDDQFISLAKRTEMASESGSDLFVSVHANSIATRSIRGVEVFSARNLNYTDKSEQQRKANHKMMYDKLSMKRASDSVDRILEDMLYSYKQSESKTLAEQLSSQVARSVKTVNRGGKQAGFYVLRNTLIPAVLVEVGFLTNPKEERMLMLSSYREQIARSIAESIFDYANGH